MASNRDWGVTGADFQVPFGGNPQWVVTQTIPPELVTYYALEPATVVMVQMYKLDDTHYIYSALIIDNLNQIVNATGRVDAGVVAEVDRLVGTGAPAAFQFGFRSPRPIVIINGSGVPATSTQFIFANSSVLQVRSGANANIQSSGILQIDSGSTYTIDGRSAPRGLLWEASSGVATGAVAVETVFLTAPSATYVAGRAYKIEWTCVANETLAGIVNYKFRRTNLAGVNKASWAKNHPIANALTDSDWVVVVNSTGVDITDTAVLTCQPTAGTVNIASGATTVPVAQCWDVGSATDYTNRIQF